MCIQNYRLVFLFFFFTYFPFFLLSQTIIPNNYYGINAWMPDSSGVNKYYGKLEENWQKIEDSNVQIVRIGGIGADKYFYTEYQILNLIDSIQQLGAEPIVQVPIWGGDSTAAHAASIVQLLNITHNRDIKYWSIGNEPNHVYDNAAYGFGGNVYGRAEYAASVREFSIAMKTVDPTIKTIAGELAWYYDVWINELLKPGGADDISGNNGTHDYIDYFSFHRYPFSRYGTQQTRALVQESPDAFISVTNDLNALIATANSTHARNNDLQYGLTEININTNNPITNEADGLGSNSFIAGQWWAEMMQTGILQKAQFMNFWSAIEGGDGSETDNGYISHTTGKLKPIYYHFQLCASHMTGTAYTATDNQNNIKAFVAKDGEGIWNILVLNYDETTSFSTKIRLNNATINGTDPLKINIAGNVDVEISATIPANSTTLLKLTETGTLIKTITYTQTDALADQAPQSDQLAREKKVFAHYLPWYDAANGNRTGWCYEGDCTDLTNIHYSNAPRIGEYSQYDSEVLEYHILTAYVAGIDGFIINLNPQSTLQKELTLKLLDQLNILKNIYPVLEDFKVMISYDNGTSDATEITNYLTYIHDNIYQHASYKDLIFVDELTDQQVLQAWSEGDNVAYYQNVHTLWGADKIHLMIRNPRQYDYSDGNFMWPNGLNNDDPSNTVNWGQQYFNDFDWGMARQTDLMDTNNANEVMMGMAYPGFDDSNVPDFWNGGVHRTFQRTVDDGETMALTWDQQINWTPLRLGGTYVVDNSWIQLITWNDWPEGTSIEPATDATYGYQALQTNYSKTEVWKGTNNIFPISCMEVPYHLFLVREAGETVLADAARSLLLQGDCAGATALLNAVVNPVSGTCLKNIDITKNVNSEYCATDTIQSTSIIVANETITYEAGKTILLNVGFEVQSAATFLASIDPCCVPSPVQNTPIATASKIVNSVSILPIENLQIKVSPNPFESAITIEYEILEDSPATIILVNTVGQIQQIETINNIGTLTIATAHLPAGIYFVQLLQGNQLVEMEKVIKVGE